MAIVALLAIFNYPLTNLPIYQILQPVWTIMFSECKDWMPSDTMGFHC